MAVVFIRCGRSVAAAFATILLLAGCESSAPLSSDPRSTKALRGDADPAPETEAPSPGATRSAADRRAANEAVRLQALELQVDYHRTKAEEALRDGLYRQALTELEKAAALMQTLGKENPRSSGKAKEVNEDLFQLYCQWAVSLTEQGRRDRDEGACDAAIARYRRAAELFPERYPQIDDEIRKVMSVKKLIRTPEIRLSR